MHRRESRRQCDRICCGHDLNEATNALRDGGKDAGLNPLDWNALARATQEVQSHRERLLRPGSASRTPME